jgi:hypothetical protein
MRWRSMRIAESNSFPNMRVSQLKVEQQNQDASWPDKAGCPAGPTAHEDRVKGSKTEVNSSSSHPPCQRGLVFWDPFRHVRVAFARVPVLTMERSGGGVIRSILSWSLDVT